ncbi:MAG: ABC transporter permease [Acidobacteriota bacterium]
MRRLFLLAVPRDRREDVEGDLEELHGRDRERHGRSVAAVLMVGHLLATTFAFLWTRLLDAFGGMSRWSLVDLRLAGRLAVREPLLHATSLFALASAIALATVGYTMVDAATRGRLPLEGGERFLVVEATDREGAERQSAELRAALARDSSTLEYVGAVAGGASNLALPQGVVRSVRHAAITPTSWRLLGATNVYGRGLQPADGVGGAAPVAVLRENLWKSLFDEPWPRADRQVQIAGVAHEIVGVVPDEVGFPLGGDLWTALDETSLRGAGPGLARPTLFAVRREESSLSEVLTELDVFAPSLSEVAPGEPALILTARRFTEPPGGVGPLGTVMIGCLVLLLLVVSANVAQLILARSTARAEELRMRHVLGASRLRLVLQLSLEVALLGACAASLGTAAAFALLRQLDAVLTERPFWLDLSGRPATALFAVALFLVSTIVCGVLPALRATSGARVRKRSSERWHAFLSIGQMAVSMALLSGALVLARSYTGLIGGNLDLPRDRVLTAQLYHSAPETLAGDGEFLLSVTRALEEIPGVEVATVASHLPRVDAPLARVEVDGASASVPRAAVGPGFFEALGTRPLSGRFFDRRDGSAEAARIAIVNEPFARRYFGGQAVGRTLREVDGEGEVGAPLEIVGVVPDLGLSAASSEKAAGYYVPLVGEPRFVSLAVRAAGTPLALEEPVRRRLVELDPLLQVRRVQLLERVADEEIAFQAGFAATLTLLGLSVLVLSLCGVYSVMSMAVSRRQREIGVRRALGAGPWRVLRTVGARSAWHVLLGGLGGLALGSALLQVQDRLLVTRLPVGESWILPAVLCLFVGSGVLAGLGPALAALRLRPTEALRDS